MKSASLNLLETSGPHRACYWTPLPHCYTKLYLVMQKPGRSTACLTLCYNIYVYIHICIMYILYYILGYMYYVYFILYFNVFNTTGKYYLKIINTTQSSSHKYETRRGNCTIVMEKLILTGRVL